MNHRQRLVQQQFLDNEQAVINRLDDTYSDSLNAVEEKIKKLEFNIEGLKEQYSWLADKDPEKEKIKSQIQSKIYQKQYQEQLKRQLDGIMSQMQIKQYTTVAEYIDECYTDGFIGTIFDAHGQGVPLIMPINQESMIRAVQLESKISNGLYTKLGYDVNTLKKRIMSEVSRGVATGSTFSEVARRLDGQMKIGRNKAMKIARTEGHRVQTTATMDAMQAAKQKGADVVKQWDSTLDARTRDSHVKVDGEIRELDKPFSNGLMYPGKGGPASEVINCRCALLQRARWALDDEELAKLKERAEYFGLDKAAEFDDFKKKYLKSTGVTNATVAEKVIAKSGKDDKIRIESPIGQKNTGKGNPSAIIHYGRPLNNKQRKILDELPEYESKATFKKSNVSMTDLSALTAATGVEFAMFTKGNERLIVRGSEIQVNITKEDAKALAKQGYKWSGHTHPGVDDLCLVSSDGDLEILKAFNQSRSVVYNSKGQFLTFQND